jgi:hypothetical protein
MIITHKVCCLNDDQQLQAKDKEFDVCLCDSVLDSMPFANAKASILELARVTNKYIFFSVISGRESGDADFCDEVVVEHTHENGTIQSYFNEQDFAAHVKSWLQDKRLPASTLQEPHGIQQRTEVEPPTRFKSLRKWPILCSSGKRIDWLIFVGLGGRSSQTDD